MLLGRQESVCAGCALPAFGLAGADAPVPDGGKAEVESADAAEEVVEPHTDSPILERPSPVRPKTSLVSGS